MRPTHTILIPLLAFAALGSGCVGTGPNTQRGAVSGTALGAIAGAIIGNNTGHGNGATGALVGAVAGGLMGGTMGNQVDHEQGTIYTSEAQATTEYVVAEPPPPPPRPADVVSVRPVPDAEWVGGYWVYNARGRYEWVPGHWEVPPPSCRAFVSPHWARRGNGYVYVNGYWRM